MARITKILDNEFRKLAGDVPSLSKLMFTQCMDIHPSFPDPPVFNDAKYVYMDKCNKNFVYYWLDKETFPNVKKIYLDSHPCEPCVFKRFSVGEHYNPSGETPLVLSENYKEYKTRWANDFDNVTINSPDEMMKDFEQL